MALAPSTLLGNPKISSGYTGSKVASFDIKSIAHGCFVQARQGVVVSPAFACTIRYKGTDAGSGEAKIFDAPFKVVKRNMSGFAAGPEKVQVVEFPESFGTGLTSLEPSKLRPAALRVAGGAAVRMALMRLLIR